MHKLLLLSSLFLILVGCIPNQPKPLQSIKHSIQQGIVYYDISFEINPSQNIFRSRQRITLTGNLAEGRKLSIYVAEDLVIDHLTLEDTAGNDLAIMKWQIVDSYSIEYWWRKSVFSEIEIQTKEKIPADGHLIVNLDYHLPIDAIQEGLAENLYDLFVSPQGSHAGGPESGAFLMVSGNLEAPFNITIKHPDTFQCAVPGEQVGFEKADGYVTVTYRANSPYDPSFSCAPYTVMSKEIKGMHVELFVPAHLDISPEMLTTAVQILSLYQEKFGEPPAHSFRVVFPNLGTQDGGGESNGNMILLSNIQSFLRYEEDQEARDTFAYLIAHEGYHLWNTWSLNWEGTHAEWWVEGGANFMASWAKEMLYGDEAGVNNRLEHISTFIEQEAYRHKNSLANLDDSWFEDWALVYEYGALVWEQLRQAVGSEALIAGLRDFYETHRNQTTSYNDFITCMEKHTEVDVATVLHQWTQQNARIDLVLQNVSIQHGEGHYVVQVDLNIKADRDYELFSTLGYKTSLDENWHLIDLHPTKTGQYRIVFESTREPLEIQIDPEYRVPQINLENNTWFSAAMKNQKRKSR